MLRLVNQLLTAFPWLEKKCSGDGETSFSVCCKIWAAFPEKMPKSSSLGFKGFSGNKKVSNPNISPGTWKKKATNMHRSFFSTKIANVAVLGPMNVYTNVITPETHAQLKAKFTSSNLV